MYHRMLPRSHSPPSVNRIAAPPSAPYNSPSSHQSQQEQSWTTPRAPQNSVTSLTMSSSVSSYPHIHYQVHPSAITDMHYESTQCLSPSNSSLLTSAMIEDESELCSTYDYPDERMTAASYGSRSSESQSSLMSIDVDQSKYSDSGLENNSLSPSDVTDSCLGVSFVVMKNDPRNFRPVHANTTTCSCNVSRSEYTNLGERPECIGHEDLSILYRYNSFIERQANGIWCGDSSKANLGDSVINSDLDTDWNNSHMDQSCTTCGDFVTSDHQSSQGVIDNMNYRSNSSLCLLSFKQCPINVNKYKLPSSLNCGENVLQSARGSLESVSEHTYESINSCSSNSSSEENYYRSLKHSQHLSQTTMDIHQCPVQNKKKSISGQQHEQPLYNSVEDIVPSRIRFNRSQMTQISDATGFMQQPLCTDAVTSSMMSKSRKKVLKGKLKTVGRYIQQLSKTQGSKPSSLKTLAIV